MTNPVWFENDLTYLPCTLPQFEALVNEILVEFNKIMAPQALDANYFAEVLMGVIHHLDRKQGTVLKSELFSGAVNMVSKHVTYHACEAIRAKLKETGPSLAAVEEGAVETPQDGA